MAKGLATKAVDDNVFAVIGPTFSGSIMVSMAETRRAEIPNFTGGEAAAITQQGNPYIFRTSFTQTTAMPKVARYIASNLKAKTVAVLFVNNDFGKGGRDSFAKAAEAAGLKVVADISTESGQVDWSAPVLRAKQSNADVIFVYTNEEESARALRELRKQGVDQADRRRDHADRPEGDRAGRRRGQRRGGARRPDGRCAEPADAEVQGQVLPGVQVHLGPQRHQGLHRHLPAEGGHREGRQARPRGGAKALHGLSVSAAKEPGVLMDVTIDANGDLDRESYIVEVKDGKQVVKETLPALGKK